MSEPRTEAGRRLFNGSWTKAPGLLDAILAIEAEARGSGELFYGLPSRTRLILASENFLDVWGTRTERGEKITAEWGEPTEHGWYEPTFTVHTEDRLSEPGALDAPWSDENGDEIERGEPDAPSSESEALTLRAALKRLGDAAIVFAISVERPMEVYDTGTLYTADEPVGPTPDSDLRDALRAARAALKAEPSPTLDVTEEKNGG